MQRIRISAVIILVLGVALGFYVYGPERGLDFWGAKRFNLGLDLRGGSQLIYQADVSALGSGDVGEAMSSLREVIERRINAFGVAEPVVQVEESSLVGGSQDHRLLIQLPGVTDIKEAIARINVTPTLDFRIERPAGPEKDQIIAAHEAAQKLLAEGKPLPNNPLLLQDPYFIPSPLTGRFLKRAQVVFGAQAVTPSISIEFNDEGTKLFADLTKANVGKPLGIYLDGVGISAPVVREEIRDGRAEISGQFTLEEARELARNLNLGALPVPITLVSTETVGATLGARAVEQGLMAGLIGFAALAVFMILWYRVPGLVAVLALAVYLALVLALFKLFGITLTAAGIAGLILSLGMAVDANILIFERLREELLAGDSIHQAIRDGFGRAWTSIRDSNFSTIISAVVLFWFGTSVIKGFALTLIIGVLASMFTAIVATRTLLLAIAPNRKLGWRKILFGVGFSH